MRSYSNVVLSDATGLSVVGAEITVLQAGTALLATIWPTDSTDGTPMKNPFRTDPAGAFQFYAPDGRYDVAVRFGARTSRVVRDIELVDALSSVHRLQAVEDGEPGAIGSLRADLAVETGGSNIGFVQDGTSPEPSDVLRELRRFVWAEQFGCSPTKTGVQNRVALQRAVETVYARGGGVVRLGSGTFPIDGFVRWRPNVALIGAGSKATILRQINESPQTIRHGYEGIGGGTVGFVGFTILGRGQVGDLPSFFDEKAINIGRSDDASGPDGADQALFNDVEIAFSRGMAIGAVAKIIVATNNYIHHAFRDGMNFSGSRRIYVSGNVVERVADDCIAIHVPFGFKGQVDTEVRVIGNRCEMGLGIKVLGGRNTVVANNTLRFCASYSVQVDADFSYGEGVGARFCVVIAGNSILDPLGIAGLSYVTGLQTGIHLGGTASKGSNPGAGLTQAVLEGRYTEEGYVLTPEKAFINYNDPSYPRPANRTIVIANNTLQCTLQPTAKFSDHGFGKYWDTQGERDMAPFVGTLRQTRAISLSGDFRGVIVNGNVIDGFETAFQGASTAIFEAVVVSQNIVMRCAKGVVMDCFEATSAVHGSLTVEQNTIDLDPYYELPGHAVNGGTWDATFNGFVTFCNNFRGLVLQRNRIANARMIAAGDEAGQVIVDNDLFWAWNGANRGIGNPGIPDVNRHFFRFSNPIETATFGTFSPTKDSAFVRSADAMPSAGYYARGHMVINHGAQVLQNGRRLHGWRRGTTGNAHVLNTDWFEVLE